MEQRKAMTQQEAVDWICDALQNQFPPIELVEIHDDIFRNEPDYDHALAEQNPQPLIDKLVHHFRQDLWESPGLLADYLAMIFTHLRRVYYNEEDDRIHFLIPDPRYPHWYSHAEE